MTTTDIKFPTTSAPGTMPQESAGRLINAFVEKTLLGAPSDTIIRRSAGLELRLRIPLPPDHPPESTTLIHTRGFQDDGPNCIWVVNDRVFRFDQNLVLAEIGQLPGTTPITIARNNAVPEKQMVAVGTTGAFNLFNDIAPTPFADPDLSTGATSVCDFDGYFVFSMLDGRIIVSDINSVNINALSFNTEQGLIGRRVVRYGGRVYYFGDKWTAVYRNAATIPFPLAREVTIPRGIVGTHAVAGWETGWANELIWVGDDFNVYKLSGYTPVPISTDDVSRAIQEAVLSGGRNFIEAYVYMFGKNAFWVLSAHDSWTWEYNLTTGEWNERQSYNKKNWKGMKSIRIFDRWFVGDEYSGDLYEVDGTHFREGMDPLIWEVHSGVMAGFPRGMVIPRASFHVTAGVGSFTTVTDPIIEISWSLDGGNKYGDAVFRRLGAPGDTAKYPSILGSGLSKGQGVRYRLRVTDPVHVGLSGGSIEAEQRGFA